jgi:hypothetical protein
VRIVPVIQVENLSKVFRVSRKDTGMAGAVKALFRPRFDAKVAVDGITFSVEPGEMVGYIGVNGAGKSTTIKMLTGILVPSGGKVQVLGRDPHRQRVANAREIGVVFGQRSQLWWDLALIESLNLITCVSAFWVMDSVPVTRVVFDNHLFAQYPLTIYPKAIGIWLTWMIPYGFASFYPASYLLGRDVGALAWLGPVVAAGLLVIGYRVWQFGLRHYASTGS